MWILNLLQFQQKIFKTLLLGLPELNSQELKKVNDQSIVFINIVDELNDHYKKMPFTKINSST